MKKFCVFLFSFSAIICFSQKNINTSNALQQVFADNTYQLTGVAVSKDGRLFTNYPFWSGEHKYSVVEILPNNQVKPYPNEEMNNWKNGDNGKDKFVCVQAVYIDNANTMWVVDPASPKQKGVYENSQKLVRINLSTNKVEQIYSLAGATDNASYINDVRVDTKTQYAYLTNSSEGGIIVLNLATGKARQVLEGTQTVMSDPSYIFKVDGKEMKKKGAIFKGNSDGIALAPDGEYLYYKPLTDAKLYRIKTSYLKDTSLDNLHLNEKVEKLGNFTTTDGMVCDKNGNVYLSDAQNYRIVKITPQLKMTTFVQDNRLIWPDSFQITDDGHMYVSCSQINKQPDYNDGINKRTTPYCIYKIKLE